MGESCGPKFIHATTPLIGDMLRRIWALVTVPSSGKRGRRLRPSLVGEGYRSGVGQHGQSRPTGPVGHVRAAWWRSRGPGRDVSEPTTGIGRSGGREGSQGGRRVRGDCARGDASQVGRGRARCAGRS